MDSEDYPNQEKGNPVFRVEIKGSAIEVNKPLCRLTDREGQILSYKSRNRAEIEAIHLSYVGQRDLRIQPVAQNDSTPADAYLIPTGRSRRGYGRTTENASTGWEKRRKEAIERDKFTCQECEAKGGPNGEVQLHVDHISPKFSGGTDELSNLQTLCKECHLEKHGSVPKSEYQTDAEIADAVTQIIELAQYPIFTLFGLKKELEIGSNAIKRLRRVLEDLEKWGDWGVVDGKFDTVYFMRKEGIEEGSIDVSGGSAIYQNYVLDKGSAVRRLGDKENKSLSEFD